MYSYFADASSITVTFTFVIKKSRYTSSLIASLVTFLECCCSCRPYSLAYTHTQQRRRRRDADALCKSRSQRGCAIASSLCTK